ncbi:MAG: S-layer y domain protein [Holophagaceae bacterium]|nr:S-layer y domain protein [Holophagaceae bacterium]
MRKTLAILSTLSLATAGFAADPHEVLGWKVSGFFQYRYEWTQNPRGVAEDMGASVPSGYGNAYIDGKNENRLNLAFFLDKSFDEGARFHAWLGNEHLSGRTTNTKTEIKEAYLAKNYGFAEVAVGRFMPDIGLGTLGGAPYQDGVSLHAGNDWVAGKLYVTKFGNVNSTQVTDVASDYGYINLNGHMTFVCADLKVRPMTGLTLSAGYFADVTSEGTACVIKSYSVGGEYKYVANQVPWFTVSGEYARNNSEGAKLLNTDLVTHASKAPLAYYGTFKFLGAHPFMKGTGGFYMQYRRAESGFDVMGMANPMVWNAPLNWTTPAGGGSAENHKGIEVGGEFTIFKGAIFKAAYGFMKSDSSTSLAAEMVHRVGGVVKIGNNVIPAAPATDKENYFTTSVFLLF